MTKTISAPPTTRLESDSTENNPAIMTRPPRKDRVTPEGSTPPTHKDQGVATQSVANSQLLLALNSLATESNVTAKVTPSGEISLEAKGGRNITFDVTQLRDFLHEVLSSRDELIQARQLAESAEKKVKLLYTELEQISELVREDKLTGALNRRGLDEAFVHEVARSARRSTPLCVALIDLDDFKRINDTFSHQAGDGALIHLTRVIKETLRPNDVLSRYGGEEFLILLPESGLDEAQSALSRLQRELAKRPFMHGGHAIAITFSAGVCLRAPGEPQDSVISRADTAQYQAKQTGKNRVLAAK